MDPKPEALDRGDHGPGVVHEGLARGREAHVVGGPFEELEAEAPLEAAQP